MPILPIDTGRYGTPEMLEVFQEETRLQKMLDVEAALAEAKAELAHRLEVAACLKEDEGEKAWQKECAEIFNAWFEKWFGSASPTS